MQSVVIKKTKLVRRFYIAVGVLLLFCLTAYTTTSFQKNRNSVVIGTNKIYVEIADSKLEQQKGLCCREKLESNRGMLFIYEKPGDYRFWMKDTNIPLDMYWINVEKKIVHIEHSVKPETYPKSFGTDTPAQYILETNAGYAKNHNIKTGDSVDF